MMKRVALAIPVIMFTLVGPRAMADSATQPDVLIQVQGAFTSSEGEVFGVSYLQDMTTFAAPTNLTYSSSGPLGQFTLVDPGASGGDGLGWQSSSGYFLSLLLFRTPGCGTTQSSECQPEVGPNEIFPPGTDVNAFANGIFLLFPPGQSNFSQSFFGDVTVKLVPEPGSMLLLGLGLGTLGMWRLRGSHWRRRMTAISRVS